MPLYVYLCSCGETQDIGHGITDSPAVYCSKCAADMKRKPQSALISFKGKGFYSTDA